MTSLSEEFGDLVDSAFTLEPTSPASSGLGVSLSPLRQCIGEKRYCVRRRRNVEKMAKGRNDFKMVREQGNE